MKRFIYIFAFGFLGLLVATLIHAGVEMLALWVIFGQPEIYVGTYWWEEWHMVHRIGSTVLWWLGLAVGLWCGFRFWRILYIEKRYGEPRF